MKIGTTPGKVGSHRESGLPMNPGTGPGIKINPGTGTGSGIRTDPGSPMSGEAPGTTAGTPLSDAATGAGDSASGSAATVVTVVPPELSFLVFFLGEASWAPSFLGLSARCVFELSTVGAS